MRRGLVISVLVALGIAGVPSIGAVAHSGEHGYFKDRFEAVSYSLNDGTLEFSGPWIEIGDDGEPGSGQVHVGADGECNNGNCLHLEGGLLSRIGVKRSADTSMMEDASLTFSLEVAGIGLLSLATLDVQVSENGSKWETLETFPLASSEGHHEPWFSVDEFRSESFGVRFLVQGLVGGQVYIDDVKIEGTLTPTSTSTSTSTTTTTSTTSSTTTTTTAPTTSTTRPTTTSTTRPTTTTTDAATTTRDDGSVPGEDSTTTTTPGTTTTSPLTPGVGTLLPGSGLRNTSVGLMVDYGGGMADDVMPQVEVLSAELSVDYLLEAESFDVVGLWLALLSLVVAIAVVGGVDSRRRRRHVDSANEESA